MAIKWSLKPIGKVVTQRCPICVTITYRAVDGVVQHINQCCPYCSEEHRDMFTFKVEQKYIDLGFMKSINIEGSKFINTSSLCLFNNLFLMLQVKKHARHEVSRWEK